MTARPRFDLSEVELSPETEALFPLHAGDAPLEQQRRFGTWWLSPFARTSGHDLIGFRLVPGVRLADCPVVWASGPAAVTVATRVDRVVPVIVLAQMLSAPRRWTDAAELLDSEWDELRAAHRALGGTDDLAALRAVAVDEELRAACAQPGAARDAAAARAFEQLDPSEARAALRQALMAAVAGQPIPVVADGGAWTAALDALAFDPDAREAAVTAAWRLFQHPAGLDAVWGRPPDPWPEPVATVAAKRLHGAARLLVAHGGAAPAAWRDDPLWAALAALADAASPFDHDGVSFIEAAAELDMRGEGERALNALTAVEFWNFLAGGPPMDGAIEAAHALARRRGWAHLTAITGAVLGNDA
jgi:hypothetical protein